MIKIFTRTPALHRKEYLSNLKIFTCKVHCHISPDDNNSNKKQITNEIYTLPNMITLSRIVASPFLAIAIANDMKTVALCGCAAAGFSDWLDGYIARKYNQATVFGGFLDPLADKVVIAALSAGLCAKGLLPLPLLCVIIGRDVLLIAGCFVLRSREIPAGAPYFDTTHSATFHITPTPLGKANTVVQFALLGLTLCNFAVGIPALSTLQPLWYVTAASTVSSGLSYWTGTGLTRLSASGVGQGPRNSPHDPHKSTDKSTGDS